MDDLESKRVMLFVADGYKRLAERAGERDAKEFIDGTSFGPDALKAIGDAFDAAWAEIASNFAGNLLQTDTARLQLATALLSIASEDSCDVQVLLLPIGVHRATALVLGGNGKSILDIGNGTAPRLLTFPSFGARAKHLPLFGHLGPFFGGRSSFCRPAPGR